MTQDALFTSESPRWVPVTVTSRVMVFALLTLTSLVDDSQTGPPRPGAPLVGAGPATTPGGSSR